MKKIGAVLLLAIAFSSCNKKLNEAMKSADKNLILQTANEYFAQKKWTNALALYDRLPNLVAGTDDAPNVVFNSAFANYYQKAYRLAGHQFKNFSVSFPDDPRKEEAAYMSALCYYEGSLDYNLDQTNTDMAINELQDFINNYPNSERSKNINTLIEELMYKQEFKAYENARQYYKMGQYKAAIVAFDNVLEDFPGTKLRAKIYEILMKSKYELAVNSRYDLKEERLETALSYTRFLEREVPNTENSKDALDFRKKLEEEKDKHAKLKVLVEKQKAEFAEKQKVEQAKIDAKETERQQKKEIQENKDNATKAKIDSAQIATPAPAATFKIRR